MSELLTLNRLSQALRLRRGWLKTEAIAGRLPCLRVGSKLLFELTAVCDELAKRAATERGGAANEWATPRLR